MHIHYQNVARSCTAELKDRGIRVNAISPGPIESGSLAGGLGNLDGLKRQLVATVPMGRMDQPEEIAKAVLLLASDEASFVTGIELAVDGGAGQV